MAFGNRRNRRRRKNPTPHFKILPPLQPQTGERAKLLVEGIYPYCALMQVVETDTHCNYVVCRGWDPRVRAYFTETPGIPVAKPYGKRFKGVYRVGQVFPCVLPLPAGFKDGNLTVPRIGQNPGEVEAAGGECRGHPFDLTEEVTLLTDDDGVFINWMILDNGPLVVRFELLEELTQFSGDIVDAARKTWDPTANGGDGGFTVDCDDIIKVGDLNEVGHFAGVNGFGRGIMEERENAPYWVCVIDDLCCPGDEQGECAY